MLVAQTTEVQTRPTTAQASIALLLARIHIQVLRKHRSKSFEKLAEYSVEENGALLLNAPSTLLPQA
jgi:hypothetical protein